MIYLLTAIGQPPGGSSTVHIYTQTLHRTTQLTQTIPRTTKKNKLGRVRAVHRLCELYPGIYLTTEEKARKNLSQGRKTSVKVVKPQSGQKNLSQGRKNSIKVVKSQSGQKNFSQDRKTLIKVVKPVRVEKAQSGQKNLSQCSDITAVPIAVEITQERVLGMCCISNNPIWN